jgi:hypothetical protein
MQSVFAGFPITLFKVNQHGKRNIAHSIDLCIPAFTIASQRKRDTVAGRAMEYSYLRRFRVFVGKTAACPHFRVE